jgi:hypothetical protein
MKHHPAETIAGLAAVLAYLTGVIVGHLIRHTAPHRRLRRPTAPGHTPR